MTNRQIPIVTQPGMGRGLVNHDERSKAYRATAMLGGAQQPRDRHWRRGGPYDQGQTSMCVPYTGKGALNTLPMSGLVPYDIRSEYDVPTFYDGARRNDEWAGEDYDGTSGLGLLRFLKSQGIIEEYRACFGVEDCLRTLSWIGPLLLGIMWMNDMFEPDSKGFLHPTGGEAGGHEIEVLGLDVSDKYVVLQNSWGRGWGDNGRAMMSFDDFEAVLENFGDAYVITR